MMARCTAFRSMLALLVGSFMATSYLNIQNGPDQLNKSSYCSCPCCGGNRQGACDRHCSGKRDRKPRRLSCKDILIRRRRRRKAKRKKQLIA